MTATEMSALLKIVEAARLVDAAAGATDDEGRYALENLTGRDMLDALDALRQALWSAK
jgi:hypothetical protein